jgi:exodeoxyribonuclease V alpha subunit
MSTAPKAAQNTQALRGQIETLFYSSPQFCAGRLKTGDGRKAMFAGQFCVREGDPVVLHGRWGMHAKYGRQFQVEWFEYDATPSAEGLANYLAKHPLLKWIGPAKAWRIAEQFAAGFDQALAERPEEIARAAGVPLATIKTLAAEWKRVEAVRSAPTILSAYGLTHHQVTTLMEKHGNSIVALLEADPQLYLYITVLLNVSRNS